MELSGACEEEFEGKINKSKLKLVLTNGKIQGYECAMICALAHTSRAVVVDFCFTSDV